MSGIVLRLWSGQTKVTFKASLVHIPHIETLSGNSVWVCLKIVYPIVPNGFADHYPYEKLLFHWEYTQHFQTNPCASPVSTITRYSQVSTHGRNEASAGDGTPAPGLHICETTAECAPVPGAHSKCSHSNSVLRHSLPISNLKSLVGFRTRSTIDIICEYIYIFIISLSHKAE